MATFTLPFSDNTGGTGTKMTHCITLTNNSSSQSNIQPNIPDYSRINNVTISLEWKTNLYLSKGDCRIYVEAYNDDYFDADGYKVDPLSQVASSYTTLSVDKNNALEDTSLRLTNYFNSEMKHVGQYAGTRNICIWFSATVTRKWYWKNLKMIFDYSPPQCLVTVKSNGNGSVSGGGTYNYGSSFAISAKPADGYRFVSWSDGNTNASRTFTVNDSIINDYQTLKTYTATFEKIPDTTPPTITAVSITPNPASSGQGIVVAVKITD